MSAGLLLASKGEAGLGLDAVLQFAMMAGNICNRIMTHVAALQTSIAALTREANGGLVWPPGKPVQTTTKSSMAQRRHQETARLR